MIYSFVINWTINFYFINGFRNNETTSVIFDKFVNQSRNEINFILSINLAPAESGGFLLKVQNMSKSEK